MLREFNPPLIGETVYSPRLSLHGIPPDDARSGYLEWTEGPYPVWAITLKSDEIGSIGIVSQDVNNRRCEIGYFIDEAHRGQGFATEATRALTHYLLFDAGYNRIEARHSPANKASRAILRKSRMVYEGLARQSRLKRGVFADRLRYSLLYDDLFTPIRDVYLQDFGTLTDGEIEVVCDSLVLSPPDMDSVPMYECSIRLHGKSVGHLRLSVGMSRTIYYAGQIGYTVWEEYRGNHYAAKACLLIKEIADRHGLSPIVITCNPDNVPSVRTLKRIGAQCVRVVAVPSDNLIYAQGDREKLIFEW